MVGLVPSLESPAMPYGYPSPTTHSQATAATPHVHTPVKLYHPDPRMDPSSSRPAIYHHHQGSNWTAPNRGPPPTYNSPHGAVDVQVYAGTTPPPVLLTHHSGGESDAMGNCLCASCNRYEPFLMFVFLFNLLFMCLCVETSCQELFDN